MPHIQGRSRDEVLLFPPSLDEYITDDSPVRCIDVFVDQLDLQALGFTRAIASPLGRPAYHPADLLKLYIYGYLNRVRSSRLLERETRRNVELIWLLKKLTPDFKTIADFRLKRVIKILGVQGLIAGMMEGLVCLRAIVWGWIRVSGWSKSISRVVWRGRMSAHQPTFHTV